MEDLSVKPIAYKYGLIYGISSFVLSVALYYTNTHTNTAISIIASLALTVGLMWVAISTYKAENEGYLSMKKGIGLGVLMGIVGTVLSVILLQVFIRYIEPSYMESIIEQARGQMEAEGKLSDEQIDQAMEIVRMTTSPTVLLISALFSGVIMGLITSAILSAILKKERAEY